MLSLRLWEVNIRIDDLNVTPHWTLVWPGVQAEAQRRHPVVHLGTTAAPATTGTVRKYF